MKVIFLDVDGVLNCKDSKSHCGEYVGVDSDKVKRLKQIVDATDAVLVLDSTWRLGYNHNNEVINNPIKYLQNKLGKHHMRIVGFTPDLGSNGVHRGREIQTWLQHNDDVVKEWIVFDDDIFDDFDACGVTQHLIKTEFCSPNGGLQDNHVQQAIEMLGRKIDDKKETSEAA